MSTTPVYIRPENRKTLVAHAIVGGALQVLVPEGLADEDIEHALADFLPRYEKQLAKLPPNDPQLDAWAQRLNQTYFAHRFTWRSIHYVVSKRPRWFGRCISALGHIKIAHRVAVLPAHLRDYVIAHELVHLQYPGHGDDFWEALDAYPNAWACRQELLAY